MLIISDLELYFFDHFILYPRDEEKALSQKVSSPHRTENQIGENQIVPANSNQRSGRDVVAEFGKTSPRHTGARFGFPPAQTQETDSRSLRASGLFVRDPQCDFLPLLGGPDRLAGRSHPQQTSALGTLHGAGGQILA